MCVSMYMQICLHLFCMDVHVNQNSFVDADVNVHGNVKGHVHVNVNLHVNGYVHVFGSGSLRGS